MTRDDAAKRPRFAHSWLDNESSDFREIHDALSLRPQLVLLPTEVLLQIFKYLDKSDLFLLLTVCREFADLIVEIL
ncbi:hypothetical protein METBISCDRAFT_29052, partial [Metschnikowia bicuspidata]